MTDEKLQQQWDDIFAEADRMFEACKRMGYASSRVIRWTYTTTNSTADSAPPATYSDGFDDGWNARDIAG